MRTDPVDYHLRPALPPDRDDLFALYRTTMQGVIQETWGWNDGWQRVEFERRFSACLVSVIEIDGRLAGMLWLESRPDCVYISQLQVSPAHQGRGIGTAVLRGVIDQAAAEGLPVALSVVFANRRAKSWYEREGFEVEAIEPPFFRMRCQPRPGLS
jgi:ribosomal protein S18 acetylase RimI-like enzyme